jgi:hypothetical protein
MEFSGQVRGLRTCINGRDNQQSSRVDSMSDHQIMQDDEWLKDSDTKEFWGAYVGQRGFSLEFRCSGSFCYGP